MELWVEPRLGSTLNKKCHERSKLSDLGQYKFKGGRVFWHSPKTKAGEDSGNRTHNIPVALPIELLQCESDLLDAARFGLSLWGARPDRSKLIWKVDARSRYKAMLTLNPDTILSIIDLAREFNVKESVTFPDEPFNPTEDWAEQVRADHADDPAFYALHTEIADLEPDQQVELVALTWLGRGDYSIEEWKEAIELAKERWNKRTAEYLIGTPMLADFLAEGLDQHGYSQE